MTRPPEPVASAAHGGGRRLFAILAAPLLAAAALAGWVVNFADKGEAPRLPLSGLIGPARTAELRHAQFAAKGRASPALVRAARAAAARDPLAYEPYLYAGLAGFPTERAVGSARDAALLREALRRKPRSRQARVLLLRHAIGAGRLGEAIAQIGVLNRLNRQYAIALLGGLGRSVTARGQIDEAVGALASHPELYPEFVKGFVAAPKPAGLVAHLGARLPARIVRDETVANPLIDRLVATGDFAAARALWQRTGAVAGGAALTDPGFGRSRAKPPFGWDYAQTGTGVAERQSEGGVFVEYYGRSAGPLLRQLVTLKPGAYRLTLEFEPLSANPGLIALRVACAPGATALGTARLASTSARRTRTVLAFAVPAQGCRGHWIELAGLPDERRKGQQLIVHRLDLVRRDLVGGTAR